MSFGQGMALSYSWKQKIMTKSSTEAELVGVDGTEQLKKLGNLSPFYLDTLTLLWESSYAESL